MIFFTNILIAFFYSIFKILLAHMIMSAWSDIDHQMQIPIAYEVWMSALHSLFQHKPMQLYWVNLLTYHDIQKYKSLSNEMLKDVSSVLESSVPNSKEIKIQAADVSMNVTTENPGHQKSHWGST